MNNLSRIPVVSWASHHPRVAAWIVLSLGMAGILVYEARDVGLLFTQWIALIAATVLVAGVCVYIVSWEDGSDSDPAAEPPEPAETAPTEPQKDS